MWYQILCISLYIFSVIYSGLASLSDPLGLSDEQTFNFDIGEDYVFGTVWPKPQQEAREDEYYTLDPHNFV